ncbi:MAG: paraquat-inducible protein A [Phycisphaerales bacterium]|nr:paraquat-inducible protein A [Phycisphaerales bacterium]
MGKAKKHAGVQRNLLATELGWWSVLLTTLLLGALVCNIFALMYPFLEFSAAFAGKELYSIPHTIQLMWSYKLYAVAILVVAFSLTFPFVKLGMMIIILWFPWPRSGRHRTLMVLRHLGRWSLLDVFIALIILVLADDQIFIGAKPRVGVALFLIAICTSMLTCELMEHLNHGQVVPKVDLLGGRRTPIYWASGWTFWLMVPLLVVALLSLLAAVGLPYFQINEFLLRHNAYSVIKSITALSSAGAPGFAITMLAFLVVLPIARLLTMAILGLLPMNRRWRRGLDMWSSIIGAWSMLDVFGLALLLFLTEGARLVKFEIHTGLYMIIVAVGIYYLTLFVGTLAIRRAISSGEKVESETS